MKKIVKVLLTLGVLAGLMVPAGLSADRPTPLFNCFLPVTLPLGAPAVISVLVPRSAKNALEARGCACCPPDCGTGGGGGGL